MAKAETAGKAAVGTKGAPPVIPPKAGAKIHDKMPPVPVVTVNTDDGKVPKAKVVRAGTKYTLVKELAEGDKMPLQCKQIIGILSKATNKTLNREELLAQMMPVIATRQPIERILGFYQSRLISGGFIKTEAIAAVTKAVDPAPKTGGMDAAPATDAKAE